MEWNINRTTSREKESMAFWPDLDLGLEEEFSNEGKKRAGSFCRTRLALLGNWYLNALA